MRNVSADMLAEFASGSVNIALLAELYFDAATLRLWTGLGTLVWNGESFTGAGNLVSVSPVEETQELEARGLVCTLNGIPSTLVATALGQKCRGRPFRLYLASVSTERRVATEDGFDVLTEDGGYVLLENQLVDTPYRLYAGVMDYMELVDEADNGVIRLNVESNLIIGQRPKIERYTPEDQKRRYPNDKGLDLINQLQDKSLVW